MQLVNDTCSCHIFVGGLGVIMFVINASVCVCVRCWLLHARTHMKIYPRAHINSRGKRGRWFCLSSAPRKQKTFAAAFLITCVFECARGPFRVLLLLRGRQALHERRPAEWKFNSTQQRLMLRAPRYICNFEFRRDRYSN